MVEVSVKLKVASKVKFMLEVAVLYIIFNMATLNTKPNEHKKHKNEDHRCLAH